MVNINKGLLAAYLFLASTYGVCASSGVFAVSAEPSDFMSDNQDNQPNLCFYEGKAYSQGAPIFLPNGLKLECSMVSSQGDTKAMVWKDIKVVKATSLESKNLHESSISDQAFHDALIKAGQDFQKAITKEYSDDKEQ